MKKLRFLFVMCFLFHAVTFIVTGTDNAGTVIVSIEWQDEKPEGTVEVLNGKFESAELTKGKVWV